MPLKNIAFAIVLLITFNAQLKAQNVNIKHAYSEKEGKNLYWLTDSTGKIITTKYNYVVKSNWAPYYLVEQAGLYGALDSTGQLVIPIQYSQLDIKNHGIVLAKTKEKYGLINYQNQILVPFEYERLSSIDTQVVVAEKNKQSGLISYKNEQILPFEFSQIQLFHHQIWAEKDGLWGAYSKQGKRLVSHQYNTIKNDHYGKVTVVQNGKYFGLVDSSFQEVVQPIYTAIERFSPHGTACAKKADFYGVINTEGKVIVPFEFKFLINTRGTIIPVRRAQSMGNWGFYAHDGRLILAAEYDIVYQPHMIVVIGSYWGAISYDGNAILPFEYQFIAELENGDVLLRKRDYCLCSLNNLTYCSDTFQSINGEGFGGFYKVRKDGKYGLMAQNWQLYVNPMCTEIYPLQNGKMRFELAGKQGYFDQSGNMISPSFGFDEIQEIPNHGYRVKMDGKANILNDSFQPQMPYVYKSLFPLGKDCLSAFAGRNRCGLISYSGDTLLPFRHGIFYTKGDWLYAKKRNKLAVYDMNLNQIIDYKYSRIENFNDSQLLVKKARKWTVANKDGVPISNNWFKGIGQLNDSLLIVWNGRKYGIADWHGKLLVPYQYDHISTRTDGGFNFNKNGETGILNADFSVRPSQ